MVDGVVDHLGHAVLPDVNTVRGKPIQQWQHGCAPHPILFQSGLNGEIEPNLIPSDALNGFRHLGRSIPPSQFGDLPVPAKTHEPQHLSAHPVAFANPYYPGRDPEDPRRADGAAGEGLMSNPRRTWRKSGPSEPTDRASRWRFTFAVRSALQPRSSPGRGGRPGPWADSETETTARSHRVARRFPVRRSSLPGR